jgi:predicted RNA-binding Zn ribbon-like protein
MYEVEGLALPKRLGGDVALDFCNTLVGWGDAVSRDYLLGYEHLVVWAGDAGLVSPEQARRLRARARREPRAAADELERARRLRSSFYSLALEPQPGPDCELVAAEARAAAAALRLELDGGRATWAFAGDVQLELPVLAIAWAMASFLASPRPAPVGRCPGRECGWLFLNPRGSRRWCLMATCGNREKARRHAAHRRAAQTSAEDVEIEEPPRGNSPRGATLTSKEGESHESHDFRAPAEGRRKSATPHASASVHRPRGGPRRSTGGR